jgi:hypothetical protein
VIELPAFMMLGSHTLPAGSTVNSDLHNNKHGVFGIGPDVTSPVASKSTLAPSNIRYLWKTGARSKTMGTL